MRHLLPCLTLFVWSLNGANAAEISSKPLPGSTSNTAHPGVSATAATSTTSTDGKGRSDLKAEAIAETSAPYTGEYLKVARTYVETMIEFGRDRYGPTHTPLFAATLDRSTKNLITTVPDMDGIRNSDRSPGGANVFHDQQLYQTLYALTQLTGAKEYAKAADETLRYFFENLQSPATGLMAWGEHIGWDFHTEQRMLSPAEGKRPAGHFDDWHEFFERWELAARSFELAPAAMHRLAQGLWDHQIHNQTTGTFSRHANYSRHGTSEGWEFPRHGGFFIALWAESYARSSDEKERAGRLRAIETLVNSFLARRHPTTGVLPLGSGLDAAYVKDLFSPPSNLEMSVDITSVAALLPPALAESVRTLSESQDATFLALPHLSGSEGFITRTDANDPSRVARRSETWATGYGAATDANIALLCVRRFEQTGVEGFRSLALAAAARYLTSTPPETITLYPVALAEAIELLLKAYDLTREPRYLHRADFFGRLAVSVFFDGASGLPRASSTHDHYETITGGDDLALSLLALHKALSVPEAPGH